MADIYHLRCRRCGTSSATQQGAYCQPCNLYLCYKALPILLGMLMTGQAGPLLQPALQPARSGCIRTRKAYTHSRFILD
ncbi:MAG TPA: hypothetical protein VGA63_12810 [Geopsychrobacteraceae bacterium]|jgi:hypothetical protein